ncbi:MAG: class I SAM-dependent methyltransferase [Ignavibacteriales bacterium]|nr:MAG: class I SAM-dependent methyltransferase [Ignavibacteriales bacterium]
MHPLKNKNYEALSTVYSHLMRTVNYKAWAKYIFAISKNHLSRNPKVLELASGEGKLANFLRVYYPDIIVSDLSFEMVKRIKGFEGYKVCLNMTSLPFKQKFDLIICAFDSINYLTSRIKIQQFFKSVKMLMNQNSIFTFDASLLNNSLKSNKSVTLKNRVNGIEYSQSSSFNTKTRIHKNEFIIQDGDNRIIKETHNQKIYDFDFYFTAAEKSGLYVSECFKAFTFEEAKAVNERVQFILRKNRQNADI